MLELLCKHGNEMYACVKCWVETESDMDEVQKVEAIAQVLALCDAAEKTGRHNVTLPIEWVRGAIEAAGRNAHE